MFQRLLLVAVAATLLNQGKSEKNYEHLERMEELRNECTRIKLEADICNRKIDAQLEYVLAKEQNEFRKSMKLFELFEKEIEKRGELNNALIGTIYGLNERLTDPKTPIESLETISILIQGVHGKISGELDSTSQYITDKIDEMLANKPIKPFELSDNRIKRISWEDRS